MGFQGFGLDPLICDTEADKNSAWTAPMLCYVIETNKLYMKLDGPGFVQMNVQAPTVPAGMISMWSGTIASIPSGWKLCDGTNGTPDLRDKFVRGSSAAADPGATGGSNSHSHAAHSYTPAGTNSGVAASATAQTLLAGTPLLNGLPANHTHPAPTFTGSAATLNHDTASNVPVFYALAFVMKS